MNENGLTAKGCDGMVTENKPKVMKNFRSGNADKIFALIENYADYILNYIDDHCDLITMFNNSFEHIDFHKDAIPMSTYMLSAISTRMKGIFASYHMNVAITSSDLLKKTKASLYMEDDCHKITSNNALRKRLMKFRACEPDPEDKTPNKKVLKEKHYKVKDLIKCLNKAFYLLDRTTKPLRYLYNDRPVKIIDGTEIEVSNKDKYEMAGVVKYAKGNKKVVRHGYKLMSSGVLLRSGFLVTHFEIAPISTNDSKLASKTIKTNRFYKGDYLLMDRGFLNTDFLIYWKGRGVDIIIPVKANMSVLNDAVAIANVENKWELVDGDDKKEVAIVEKMPFTDKTTSKKIEKETPHKYNIAVIRFKKTDNFFNDREETDPDAELIEGEYKYVGIYCTDETLTGNQVLALYKKRWGIEVSFKDQKSHWGLEDFKSTFYELIVFYLATTMLAYDIAEVFRSLPIGREIGRRSIPEYIKMKNTDISHAKQEIFIKSEANYTILKLFEFADEIRNLSEPLYAKLKPAMF